MWPKIRKVIAWTLGIIAGGVMIVFSSSLLIIYLLLRQYRKCNTESKS